MKRPPLTDKDGEVRELTFEDFKNSQPLVEVHPELIEAMQRMRNRGGRPKVDKPKKLFGFRMDQKVIDGIKATGRGYNARVESVLRDALSAGKLDQPHDLLGRKRETNQAKGRSRKA